jgi:uracil-DNA glycosylase
MTLANELPRAWKKVLGPAMAHPSFAQLENYVDEQYQAGPVFPPREQLFASLELTDPHQVKIVLLGQDPYPTAGNANGLAFSVTKSVKIPASLKNLFAGLHADLGLPVPTHGDLSAWAKRGVLLLNTVLTVREQEAHSHKKRGWEEFTTAILRSVAAQPRPVVFFCLGKPAQKLVESLGTSQPRVCAPHPSPLNGNAFVETAKREKVFSQINALLGSPFDWSV